MSENISSSNNSLPPFLPSSGNTSSVMDYCFKSPVGIFIITAFAIANVLVLLPLYISVLCVGLQKWRQQRSNVAMMHTDIFTYNMVVMELIGVVGTILMTWGLHVDYPQLVNISGFGFSFSLAGQMFFHILTCVERYLAVVFPVTYLSLRKRKAITIRNISVGCVWLLCFAWVVVGAMNKYKTFSFLNYVLVTTVLIAISVVNVSILCVLIQPGPGERSGREQRNQSKRKVFVTIIVILGVLSLRFVWDIISTAMAGYQQLSMNQRCSIMAFTFWTYLPSSLVLPLLFLQRARKQ